MDVFLRRSLRSDISFLRQMLYESVYWRAIASGTAPPFEEGLADPEVNKSLVDWGEREGDTAVIALVNSVPAGAAWYRFWSDDNFIRGYIEEAIPALIIAVHRDYRRLGLGQKMIRWLVDSASKQSIQKISLMVSKDNYAIDLYKKCDFVEFADQGDSILMLRRTT